jgi:tetratricopeptide (TPR) repeat protein/DNA-binding CsgD family transcriptional regulator
MKKPDQFFVFLIICCSLLELNAQNTELDSLKNLLQLNGKPDTVRVNLLNRVASISYSTDIDNTLKYAEEARKLADNLNYRKGIAESIRLTGVYYRYKSDYPQALEKYQKAVKIFEEIEDKTGIARCLANIGVIHRKQGNYTQALDYYERALKLNEEFNNKLGISTCLNNIGIIYRNQGHYPQALEYYQKSLRINEQLGNKIEIANVLNNIGNIYWNQGNLSQAIDYYQQALDIRETIGDKQGIAIGFVNIGNIYWKQDNFERALAYYQNSLSLGEEIGNQQIISYCINNIGIIYRELENYPKAIEYFQQGLTIKENIGEKPGICEIYGNMVSVYIKTKNYNEALDYAKKSFAIAKELELLENQKETYEQLSDIYAATNNYKKAYESHVLYKELNDSIFNEENIKEIAGLELQYKFEKEKQAIELEQQKKEAVHAEQVKRQMSVRNYFIGGFILMVLLVLAVLLSLVQKRKANLILASQKNKIEEKNKELLVLNKEIQDQNALIHLNTKMIIKLENDKHEIELAGKQRDLESVQINNQLKIKMKADLIKELQNLKKNNSNNDTGIQSIILKLKYQIEEEKKIDLLQNNIEVVGSDFHDRIKHQFPDLSKTELELLSLIKLKLSNKQIAIQRNTSSNTINVAFHRLKQKCHFDSTNDLKSYIEGF